MCVRCRKSVCAECVTKVDGINYCVGCLEVIAAERRSMAPPAPVSSRAGIAWVIAGFVLLSLMLTALLEATLPG